MSKRLPAIALLVCLAAASGPAPAASAPAARVQVEGQWFDGQAEIGGTVLRLNGTGVRAVAWFKGYAAGLYLAAPATTPAQAVEMSGPKRLQIRMLKNVPAEEFVKAVNKGVARNVTPHELAALQDRLAQFARQVGALGQVKTGDVVNLDHEPGRGLTMSVNGTLRGELIAGDEMFAAVLKSFVGLRPYDEKLKAGLLGRKA
jgi:Chalcone isomerase-like